MSVPHSSAKPKSQPETAGEESTRNGQKHILCPRGDDQFLAVIFPTVLGFDFKGVRSPFCCHDLAVHERCIPVFVQLGPYLSAELRGRGSVARQKGMHFLGRRVPVRIRNRNEKVGTTDAGKRHGSLKASRASSDDDGVVHARSRGQ